METATFTGTHVTVPLSKPYEEVIQTERRRTVRHNPRGAGRIRGAQPPAGGQGHRRGLLRRPGGAGGGPADEGGHSVR
jgi:hypothetical protein